MPSARWLPRSSRIQTHIGLAFGGLAMLVFAIVALVSGSQARSAVERQANRALALVARDFAAALDRGMAERYREVQNLAALQTLIDTDIDAAGWRNLLTALQRSFADYSWIGVVGEDGVVQAATGGLLEGRDVSARPWFAQGRERAFAGDVHDALLLASLLPGKRPNEPLRLMDFSAPIQRGGGTQGVFGAHLDWRWIERLRDEVLHALASDGTVELFIVSKAGETLLGTAHTHFAAWHHDALDDVARGDAGPVRWSDGLRYLTSARLSGPIGDHPGLGWTIVARQPYDAAMAAADALQRRILAIGAVGALLFGIAGWWLAGWLMRPLRAVAHEAGVLAGQPRSARLDEVAQLGAALSALLARLRERERSLVEMNTTLEARVAARTAMLDEVNAELRSFGRSVSHDVRAPVGSVSQMIRLVLDQPGAQLDGQSRDMLQLAEDECGRITRLLGGLMRLASVEQRPLAQAPVCMRSLATAVVTQLNVRRMGNEPEAALPEVVIDPLPGVVGDEVLLRQVWENLLANAYKFTVRQAQARIRVGATLDGGMVTYTVHDNGPGFDPAAADQLFEPFKRLHAQAEYDGTGVGLSIAKRIVHRHGGRIWACARPGEGAAFSFALPVDPAGSTAGSMTSSVAGSMAGSMDVSPGPSAAAAAATA